MKPLPLLPLVQDFFLHYLAAQRHASPATRASYRDALRLLAQFVHRRTGRSPSRQGLGDWRPARLLEFLDHLETQRQNGVTTRNARLAAVRSFLRYVGQRLPQAQRQVASTLALPCKRYDRPVLGYLSKPELRAVLRAPDRHTASGQRDYALFALLYETGARVSELLALNRQDLHLGRPPTVRLWGKGRKARALPLRAATAQRLARWLAPGPNHPEAPVFVNRLGQRLTRFGATKRLQAALTHAARQCPTLRRPRLSLHTFRHPTAMHMLQAGVDLTVIAMWLGHEQLNSTHRYLELDLALKQKCLRRLPQLPRLARQFKPSDRLLAFLEGL